eukprot:ctg_1302.g555
MAVASSHGMHDTGERRVPLHNALAGTVRLHRASAAASRSPSVHQFGGGVRRDAPALQPVSAGDIVGGVVHRRGIVVWHAAPRALLRERRVALAAAPAQHGVVPDASPGGPAGQSADHGAVRLLGLYAARVAHGSVDTRARVYLGVRVDIDEHAVDQIVGRAAAAGFRQLRVDAQPRAHVVCERALVHRHGVRHLLGGVSDAARAGAASSARPMAAGERHVRAGDGGGDARRGGVHIAPSGQPTFPGGRGGWWPAGRRLRAGSVFHVRRQYGGALPSGTDVSAPGHGRHGARVRRTGVCCEHAPRGCGVNGRCGLEVIWDAA